MTRVILEQEWSKLAHLTGPTEVCDSSGRTLGYFTPAAGHNPYEDIEIPISPEELDRRLRESARYTTEDVLKHLEAKRANLTGPTEVCASSDRPIGYVTPADTASHQNVEVPFTDEELERFAREPGGRALDEILGDLESKA